MENSKYFEKILKDKYYSEVYKKYLNIDTVIKAGFILDDFNIDEEFYNLDFLTTPVSKIIDNLEKSKSNNPVVLLTTGGFDPIHDGHIYMMEFAKKTLEQNGYDVVGGYFSPSHQTYVSTKPYCKTNSLERIDLCQEVIKDSNWLMIDPWEALYVKTYINFTDVISRLELYLQKHINGKIKVAYVFGGDNSEFMYCFENQGIGVCVEREGYSDKFEEMKNKFTGKNNFFINNKSIVSTYSSRTIRKRKIYDLSEKDYSIDDGDYVIRNENLIPLENYKKIVSEELLKKAHKNFLEDLKKIFEESFDNRLKIKTIDMQEQLEIAHSKLDSRKTISLDTYYKGTYSIETSRLFDISDIQKNYIKLIGRIGFENIENQIENIESGKYILVDDDSATGKTIREVMSLLPNRINIEKIYLLANIFNKKIFDIVDLRDFIVGASCGGLVVRLPNKDVVRVPYMLPYVSLKSRASIPAIKEIEMSVKLWKINKKFYQKLGNNIVLSQTDYGFKKLMNYIGFSDDALLTDICDWHIKNLNKGIVNE